MKYTYIPTLALIGFFFVQTSCYFSTKKVVESIPGIKLVYAVNKKCATIKNTLIEIPADFKQGVLDGDVNSMIVFSKAFICRLVPLLIEAHDRLHSPIKVYIASVLHNGYWEKGGVYQEDGAERLLYINKYGGTDAVMNSCIISYWNTLCKTWIDGTSDSLKDQAALRAGKNMALALTSTLQIVWPCVKLVYKMATENEWKNEILIKDLTVINSSILFEEEEEDSEL